MKNLISSPIGLIHTITAILAVISGTIVVLNKKGTFFHKAVGRVYVILMLLLNITAFGIYRLFSGFGIFHAFALLSLFSIIGGMYPVLNRTKVKNWYAHHLETMSWSVVGLYAALAAEISVRFFSSQYFFWITALSGGIVTTVGSIIIKKMKKKAVLGQL